MSGCDVFIFNYCYDDNLCELIKCIIMGLAARSAHSSIFFVCVFDCVVEAISV